ncbi:hypothetical protein [Alkalihalobacillus pseudalcaliphilus]|uniref:hypothetical protein n=1 Tax=Alkalihalobacillus pseudalcaliphilus TaxID=79884 RepID=UPI00064DB4B4|nr:hypothetical protein [Alkalihalobacillus pseudalcaliphilus]KMK75217.1 hypothetical protein AB990_17450 [Alkalihalobacillus pseudalcaliphilus]
MDKLSRPQVTVIDFARTISTIFVEIKGYDQVADKNFHDHVKFLGRRLYGDIIHSEKSTLSPECRLFVEDNLNEKYKDGYFE